MTIKITLVSSSTTLDHLMADADDSRKQTIKINRQDLINLILDHTVMSTALRQSSTFKVTEPEHRERPRLRHGQPV